MANTIAVVAKSGAGKSTSYGNIPELSIKGLDPKETFIINIMGKPLPFRGWKAQYTEFTGKSGNYLCTADAKTIMSAIDFVQKNRPELTNILIDDFQYIMASKFMADAKVTGFQKFTDLAKDTYDVLMKGMSLPDNYNFIILTHSEENNEGSLKMKTIGKLLDEKVTLEGLFTYVLYCDAIEDPKKKEITRMFVTNYDGKYPAKSPVGCFKELHIPNDLSIVLQTIKEYNGE